MMFLPIAVSDAAVKKAFYNLVQYVFGGKFKNHITISVMAKTISEFLPIKLNITFPMKYSLLTLRQFGSCGLRKKYSVKSVCVQMLWNTCHLALDNLTNEDSLPDNENIALASMNSRGEKITTKAAAPKSSTVTAVTSGAQPSTHYSDRL